MGPREGPLLAFGAVALAVGLAILDTRVERVNDRVEDYRRILERRQQPRPASPAEPRKNGQGPSL